MYRKLYDLYVSVHPTCLSRERQPKVNEIWKRLKEGENFAQGFKAEMERLSLLRGKGTLHSFLAKTNAKDSTSQSTASKPTSTPPDLDLSQNNIEDLEIIFEGELVPVNPQSSAEDEMEASGSGKILPNVS